MTPDKEPTGLPHETEPGWNKLQQRRELLYHCTVPPSELTTSFFRPDEYAVYRLLDTSNLALGGCIIFGKVEGKWYANVSARFLVMYLLELRTGNHEHGR